jgi:hypothetical protein
MGTNSQLELRVNEVLRAMVKIWQMAAPKTNYVCESNVGTGYWLALS